VHFNTILQSNGCDVEGLNIELCVCGGGLKAEGLSSLETPHFNH